MYFEDIFGRQYDIPKLPQIGDYSFRKELYCQCKDRNENKYLDWLFDGLYESDNGLFQCYTCKTCKTKFYWHFPIDEDKQVSAITDMSSLHFLDRYQLLYKHIIDRYNYEIYDFDYKVMAFFSGGETNVLQITIERNELNLSLLEKHFSGVFKLPDMKEFPFRLDDFKQRTITMSISLDEFRYKDHLNDIGTFDFIFYFMKNSVDSLSSQKYPYCGFDSDYRKRCLKKYGGIKIYNDSFRVKSYGEHGDDWLGLSERQRQSPYGVGQKKGGYRIKPNQIAGAVYVPNAKNLFFFDEEMQVLYSLKNILIQIIEEFENDRNTIMYNLSQLYKTSNSKESIARDIPKTIFYEREKSYENESLSEKLRNEKEIITEGCNILENTLDQKDNKQMLLRGLATLGIFVTSFAHELKGISYSLLPRTTLLKERLQSFISEEQLNGLDPFDNPFYHIELIKQEDQELQEWLQFFLNTMRGEKRERKAVSLYEYFKAFYQLWKEWLSHKSILLIVDEIPKELFIQAFEMDLDSIFNNFLANSVYSLLRSDVKRKEIKVSVYRDHDSVIIDFIDNGKGLDRDYKSDPNVIFKASETSYKDMYGNKVGTGMGLYIAKSIVDSYPYASISVIQTEIGFGIRVIFKLTN